MVKQLEVLRYGQKEKLLELPSGRSSELGDYLP